MNPGKHREYWRRLIPTASKDATGHTVYTWAQGDEIPGRSEGSTGTMTTRAGVNRPDGDRTFFYAPGHTLEAGDRLTDPHGITWDVLRIDPDSWEWEVSIERVAV